MQIEDIEAHINKLCTGLVMRVREQARGVHRWPEENSALQKVLSVVNELERVNEILEEQVRQRRASKRGVQTRNILAQAFQTAVTRVSAIEPEAAQALPDLDAPRCRLDGRIFGVKEILRFLGETARTGKVTVEAAEETFVVCLAKGEVVGATSSNSPRGTRLGDILVDRYGVDRKVLDELVERYAGRRQLGRALETEDLVSSAIIQDALRFQTVQLFERLLACEGRDIVFEKTADLGRQEDAPTMSLTEILINGILA